MKQNLGCVLNGHKWVKSYANWFGGFIHKCKNCGDKVKCLWHGSLGQEDCPACVAAWRLRGPDTRPAHVIQFCDDLEKI